LAIAVPKGVLKSGSPGFGVAYPPTCIFTKNTSPGLLSCIDCAIA